MSTEYLFNRLISFKDINTKTNLKIELVNSQYWLVDDFTNTLLITTHVEDEIFIHELTSYGLNNPTKIMDTLIETFNVKFITDNEKEIIFHEPDADVEKMFNEVTAKFGYVIGIKNINLPERNLDEYNKFKNI